MGRALAKLLGILGSDEKPIDELQLVAAQDRAQQRSIDLEESVDELSKMIRRMKRKPRGNDKS